jgi:RNA polymerase sigma factor for flagellar operon FliA
VVDATSREQLITSHLELPRKIAALLYPRVRDHIELEELISLGNAGLTEAAARYQPGSGASFATFAYYRVHGAIVDGLRRYSALPRRTWARLSALRAASEYLEAQGNQRAGALASGAREPSLEDSLHAVKSAIAAIQTVYLASLEALQEQGEDISDPGASADEQLQRAQLSVRVRAALDALPERERTLLNLHYFEGKSLQDAGAALGISKSWASRLHAQAVDRLKAALRSSDPGG